MTITTWQEVESLIEEFLEQYYNASWGPAHIALEDYNLYDDQIEWCMSLIDGVLLYRSGNNKEAIAQKNREILERLDWYADHEYAELVATHMFLRRLLTISEDVRISYHGDWLGEE